MYRAPKLLALLAVLATIAVSGCGESPTAPESPDSPAEPVKTPVSAVITSIGITEMPAKKADGSDWDLALLAADRRPDLYVVLREGDQPADFTSGTISNVLTDGTYVFQHPKDSSSGKLPATLPYGSTHRVYVMDDDFGSGDDRLGWITVNLPAAYRGDNATILNYIYTDSGGRLSVWIRGTWNY